MAPNTKSKKRGTGTSGSADTLQLTFDFAEPNTTRAIATHTISRKHVEVIPPSRPTITSIVSHQADKAIEGADESKYLLHQADKYEERAFKALLFFIGFACLTLLGKSGVPMPNFLSDKIGIPAVSNTRLMAGMLASATFLCCAALGYFALRIRQHSPQLRLNLVQKTWAGYFAQYILWTCGVLVVAMLIAVLLIAWRDIFYLVTYIVDRQLYTLDGWEPVRR
jgi:hypothetical protein